MHLLSKWLKGRQFKFSLVEQKETTLAEALRKAAVFIRTIEICADGSDASRKAKPSTDRNHSWGDKNHGSGDRRPRLEAVDPQFTTDP